MVVLSKKTTLKKQKLVVTTRTIPITGYQDTYAHHCLHLHFLFNTITCPHIDFLYLLLLCYVCHIWFSVINIITLLFLFIWIIVAGILLAVFFKKRLLCMNLKWLLSNIHFIDWFFTCSDLFVVSFHFNYCSWYVFMELTFLCLWDHYYLISFHWLIHYLPRSVVSFFSNKWLYPVCY